MGTVKTLLGFALWILAALAAGALGSLFTPGEWYAAMSKPSWTPPNEIFAPVWTVMYILMGIAAGMVWRRAGFSSASIGIVLFIGQLILNVLWSYLFFGLHRPGWAFLEISVLWGVVLATLVAFRGVRPAAGYLLLPYLLWISFALVLNFALWRMNV